MIAGSCSIFRVFESLNAYLMFLAIETLSGVIESGTRKALRVSFAHQWHFLLEYLINFFESLCKSMNLFGILFFSIL